MQWIWVIPVAVLAFLYPFGRIVDEHRHGRPITQSGYYCGLFVIQWVGFIGAVGVSLVGTTPEDALITAICWIFGCTIALPFAWLAGTRIASGT